MRAVGRYGGRAVRGFVSAVLFTALPAYRLPAQSSPAIRAAVQLASEGRSDSARRVVEVELNRARPGDSLFVEALYWRARLAPGGDAAERDLRRIVIEFGNSAWADDALLQLTQLAIAAANPAAALDYTARLRADYPGSELRARAALWGGRAAFDVGEPRTACALLDSARAEAAGDVEFVNQVTFYRGRCTATALAARDSTTIAPVVPGPRPPAPAPPPPAPGLRPPAPGLSFEVQVAAANSARAAHDIVRRLGRSGLRARVVAAARNVHRVRLGPYATSVTADSVARAAKRAVGGRPFVVRLP